MKRILEIIEDIKRILDEQDEEIQKFKDRLDNAEKENITLRKEMEEYREAVSRLEELVKEAGARRKDKKTPGHKAEESRGDAGRKSSRTDHDSGGFVIP